MILFLLEGGCGGGGGGGGALFFANTKCILKTDLRMHFVFVGFV